jgi:hypothetical protein
VTLANHLSDDTLSVLVDEQLSPAELQAARAHLETCARCTEQLAELRALKALLGDLPELDLPRDFALGPRLVGDPPNVIRLEQWYTWTRAAAASLAAAFVLLVGGTVYLDTVAPPRATTAFEVRSRESVTASAPKAAAPAAAPATARAAAPTTAPAAAIAPAAPPQSNAVPGAPAAARDSAQSASAPASAGAAAAPQPAPAQLSARPQPAAAEAPPSATGQPTPETADQTAAATRVQPLPTLPPTPVPQPTLAPAAPFASSAVPQVVDPAAPLRTTAAVVGLLAVFVLLGALVVRHRLSRARAPISLQE